MKPSIRLILKSYLLTILLLALVIGGIQSQGVVTRAGKITTSDSPVSVPVTVEGFKQVGAISLKLAYDPSILHFTGIENPLGSPLTVQANGIVSGEPAAGLIIMSWYCDYAVIREGITLPDGSVLVNLHFDAVNPGTSPLAWLTDDDYGNGCEYMDATTQDPYPDEPGETYYRDGYVTIVSQNQLDSYVILGSGNVFLGEGNRVARGSVGSTNPGGMVEIGPNSCVNGPGAFVKAKNILLHPPVDVPVTYRSPVTVVLPDFLPNEKSANRYGNLIVHNNTIRSYPGNFREVNIGSDCRVTFTTGTVFDKIKIGAGSTVVFQQPDLSIRSVNLADGAPGLPGRILFAGDAVVRIREGMMTGRFTEINTDGDHHVILYIGSDGPSFEFRVKPGGPATVNASIYAPYGRLIVDGGKDFPTYMNGVFIAGQVISGNDNVFWNQDVPVFASRMKPVKDRAYSIFDMAGNPDGASLRIFPNPSNGSATLEFSVPEPVWTTVSLYDSNGRQVRQVYQGYPEAGGVSRVTLDGPRDGGTFFIELRSGKSSRSLTWVTTRN